MASSTVFMKRNDTRPHLDVVLSDVDGLPIDLSVSEIDQSNIKFTMIDAESSNIKIDSTNTTLLSADDGGAVGSDGKIRYT
ncbi:hypothetical protein H8D85_01690 [bacterium]|nr:hypothetical protein [bacterium]